MINNIKHNLISINQVCEKYGVKSLYLFGSATDNSFTEKSDLDFLIDYFKDEEGLPKEPFDYFDILFSLESITGRKVDLVVKDAVRNSYFIKSLNKSKVLIYEKGN
ncbi:MAG: nucleotidyltransferase domain-containing protein [Ferruginibacter sp.]